MLELKRLSAILLLFVFLMPFLLKTTLVMNWVINNDFIANTLCEKRYDYLNDCQGVCYINKQLSAVDNQLSKNQPAKQSPSIIVVENISPYFLDDELKVNLYFSESTISITDLEIIHISSSPLKDIFHPPQFV